MYRFALLVIFVTLLTSSIAQAASYKKTDETIVDPILHIYGSTHDYSGNNLELEANLTVVNLDYANLYWADLTHAKGTGANLTYANLYRADLAGATLSSAYLTYVTLEYAELDYATFSTGTILRNGQTVKQHGFDAAGLEALPSAR